VHAFLDSVGSLPDGMRVGAVGSRTADILAECGISVDFIPTRFTSSVWPEEFANRFPKPTHVLLPTSDRGGMAVPPVFKERGIRLTPIVCYRTRCAPVEMPGHLDALVFCSPSSVDCFRDQHGPAAWDGVRLVAIGDRTQRHLAMLGYPCRVPERYTVTDAVALAIRLLNEENE